LKVERDFLGDLFGGVGRGKDFHTDFGRFNKTDHGTHLVTPLRRKPSHIYGFNAIRR
jgi:hypothetical protein